MVDFGVTNTGFVRKTNIQVRESMDSRLRELFGEDVDLTPSSPLKLMTDLFVLELSKLWLELENTYEAGFLVTAADQALEDIGTIVGVDRFDAIAAEGSATFFREVPLPSGATKTIPAGTIMQTAESEPRQFKTNAVTFWSPQIDDEEYLDASNPTSTYSVENHVGEIVTISGSDAVDYTSGSTYSARDITISGSAVPAGVTIYTTYKPISKTTEVTALEFGIDGNVPANTVTVLESPISFVHFIRNEESISGGVAKETDSELRERIRAASAGIGKATKSAIEFAIGNVTGVTNVIVESPWLRDETDIIVADGTTEVQVTNVPLSSITSASGSTSGALTVDSFNSETGVITLTTSTTVSENVTIVYKYESLGEIKIYVVGGTVGDENTDDTIVNAIEETRAAGIKSVGNGTGDPDAEGVATAPWSWFYRPETAPLDVSLTIYFDDDTNLSSASQDAIADDIEAKIADFIENFEMSDKLYKNKLFQLAISENTDIIDTELTAWSVDSVSKATTLSYIDASISEVPVVGSIVVTVG